MAFLAQNVGLWLGRVELVARGADEHRREAERWLERGNPLQARVHAQALLDRVPGSPIGLALLVDATEAAGLDDEAVEALRKLCEAAPWRGELWVRLGQALARSGAPVADRAAAFQRALDPSVEPSSRREALLALADLDLAAGDPWRAQRWLDGLKLKAVEPDIALRSLEVALALGDRDRVEASLGGVREPGPLDGRGALACGRGRAVMGDPSALDLLLRAWILDAAGASEALASYVSVSRDVVHVARVRAVLSGDGYDEEPTFALSLALAEGREEDARTALVRIARSGDRKAARTLLGIAVERRDGTALQTALDVLGEDAPQEALALGRVVRAAREDRFAEVEAEADKLAGAEAPVRAWVRSVRVAAWRARLAGYDDGPAEVLAALRRIAASWDRLDLVGRCAALSVERERPLRVAVVGEFNAGKSTFINALIGADVAPTGVLPTTATLHWLTWAPDPFARILVRGGPDRIVSHAALKEALREIQAGGGVPREVHICAPIERLKKMELLDTPGFNAPDADHIAAARRAVEEAHVMLWVFDASQPLKDTERVVLEAIAATGVPVQPLINKRDRVQEGDVAALVEHVEQGLEGIGLTLVGPVQALSARLALAGRLGDAQSYARSGWEQVERLLTSELANRSEELRAAGVQRKAWSIAQALLEHTAPSSKRWEAARGAEARAEQATRLWSLNRSECEQIVEQLSGPMQQLAEDLRPLRIASIPGDEPQARAYAEARMVARVSVPLAQALANASGLGPDSWQALSQSVGLVLRGAAAVDPFGGLGWLLVQACARAAHDVLARREARAEVDEEAVRTGRLEAIAEAIGTGLREQRGSGRVAG